MTETEKITHKVYDRYWTAARLARAENDEMYRRLDAGETVRLSNCKRFAVNLDGKQKPRIEFHAALAVLIVGVMLGAFLLIEGAIALWGGK